MFNNLRADLQCYGGDWTRPGFWVMTVYRFGRWRYGIRSAIIRKPLSMIYKAAYLFVQLLTGIELPCEVPVGKSFRIDHHGGIVVSGFASFGDNCVLRNGVTVGLQRAAEPAAPQVGNNVSFGAGAKVLGAIEIGDNVSIGANAVVINSVPANSLAVGIPARIIPVTPENGSHTHSVVEEQL
ncbi:MAG: serine O-acetyltransferase [Calditrichia bacterium]